MNHRAALWNSSPTNLRGQDQIQGQHEEQRREARENKRYLKQNGDWLGVQGVNPGTGRWDTEPSSEGSWDQGRNNRNCPTEMHSTIDKHTAILNNGLTGLQLEDDIPDFYGKLSSGTDHMDTSEVRLKLRHKLRSRMKPHLKLPPRTSSLSLGVKPDRHEAGQEWGRLRRCMSRLSNLKKKNSHNIMISRSSEDLQRDNVDAMSTTLTTNCDLHDHQSDKSNTNLERAERSYPVKQMQPNCRLRQEILEKTNLIHSQSCQSSIHNEAWMEKETYHSTRVDLGSMRRSASTPIISIPGFDQQMSPFSPTTFHVDTTFMNHGVNSGGQGDLFIHNTESFPRS